MLRWIARAMMFAFGIVLGVQLGVRTLLRYRPQVVPPELERILGYPLRLSYRDPARVIDFAGARRNSSVVDAGCGKGLFAVELARRVGEGGTVHCVDVQAEMIEHTRRRLDYAGMHNVRLAVTSIEHMPIESETVDMVLMMAVLPLVPDKSRALREVRRVLKPGGTLVVGDEILEPDYARPATVRNWAEQNGFQLVARNGSSLAYLLKFVKPLSPLDVIAHT